MKPKLSKRNCQVCRFYKTSNKSADRRKRNIHGNAVQSFSQPLVRTVRIVAWRSNELVCTLQALNGDENVVWLEKEDIEEQ